MKQILSGIAIAAALMIVGSPLGYAQAVPRDGSVRTGVSAQLTSAQRGAIVALLERHWGPYVQLAYKADPAAWSRRMASTFAAASDTNLQRAATMATFQGMVDALTGQRVTDAEVVDALATKAQVLKSDPMTSLLGDVSKDLVYTPLTPCRVVDTRVAGGVIAGRSERDFIGYTSTDFSAQGGITGSNCGIPPNPGALVINVTGVDSTKGGYLTVYPYKTTRPLASSLNYAAGQIVGNEIVAGMTGGSASDQFSVYASTTSDVVVDVVGYFMAPESTALNITTVTNQLTVAAHAKATIPYAACPAHFAMTGGYCQGPSDFSYVSGSTGPAACGMSNSATTSGVFAAVTQCAQVPGR